MDAEDEARKRERLQGADKPAYALGSVHIYRGGFHKGLAGWRVVIVGVLRGEQLISEQEIVGEVLEGDRLEVRPVIKGRLSFVTYDAAPGDLEPTGESWSD